MTWPRSTSWKWGTSMKIRPADKQKIEEYARSLLDAAKGEGSAQLDLHQLRKAARFTPEVFETLGRMQNETDLTLLSQLYDDLRTMLNNDEDVIAVEATTAVPMDAELRKAVREKCSKDLGVPVYLVEVVEPKILGGIILEVNGRRRDASVRAQLTNIRKSLSTSFSGGVE